VLAHVTRRALALAALTCVVCAGETRAASDASGTAAASFLSVGSGASVLSMGGATLATGTDLASAAWNPASLARVDALQFALTHAPMPGGATQDWLAAGGRFGGEWRWSTQALFHREAGIEGRDASNNPTGELSATDLGVGAHLARRFGRSLDVGLGAEWIHESLAGTPGSGVAFSGGLRTSVGRYGFGLAARHVGGGMSYGGARYDLPGVIAFGASYEDPARGLRVAADLESPTHYYRSLRLGGEWLWRGQLALRAGYRSELGNTDAARLSGPTFGVGTGAGSLWMDYAFTPDGSEGAGSHRLGLTFRPGTTTRATGGRTVGEAAPAKPRERAARPAPASARPAASKPAPAASAESRATPGIVPVTASPAAAVPSSSTEAKRPEAESKAAAKPVSDADVPVPPVTPVKGADKVAMPSSGAAANPPAAVVTPGNSTGASANATAKPAAEKRAKAGTSAPAKSAASPGTPQAAASAPAKSAPAKTSAAPSTSTANAAPKRDAGSNASANAGGAGTTLASSQPPVESVVPPARPKSVIVSQGETLASIARRWNTSVAAIMMANDRVNEKVTPGQRLKLPPATKK
jgi:LysM repeat protein